MLLQLQDAEDMLDEIGAETLSMLLGLAGGEDAHQGLVEDAVEGVAELQDDLLGGALVAGGFDAKGQPVVHLEFAEAVVLEFSAEEHRLDGRDESRLPHGHLVG